MHMYRKYIPPQRRPTMLTAFPTRNIHNSNKLPPQIITIRQPSSYTNIETKQPKIKQRLRLRPRASAGAMSLVIGKRR